MKRRMIVVLAMKKKHERTLRLRTFGNIQNMQTTTETILVQKKIPVKPHTKFNIIRSV